MAGTRIWKQERETTEDGGQTDPPMAMVCVREQAKKEFDHTERNSLAESTADVVLFDESTSTKGRAEADRETSKRDALVSATAAFIANHTPGSELAIVGFSNDAHVILPMRNVTTDRMDVIAGLFAMPAPCGSTFMAKALVMARDLLCRCSQDIVRRAFLVTDGLPNDDPRQAAADLKADGVLLTTIGFGIRGENVDENLLRDMASVGPDGSPAYRHFTDIGGLTHFMATSSRFIRK